MAEGEITTFTALTEKFNLPPGNYKKPKLLYCSNGGHFLRILPDGTVDGTRDRSDQHTDTKRGMSVPGKAGGEPLQHLYIQEACREELVCWPQKEWKLQTRSSDSLWPESNLVSSPASLF
ncbi:PREDICTED: fibroblast growth factor 1 isoform X3 [Colobus angolensis palliatus]|uniref:fibroblast growth factor 1 isoform X3 n=1 Tax=Colobus angolensis palliatus TaxID=336983 RepID=UPI0005F4D5B3|nr:PREDICTED: fibroblast growth factor 1 isoform X3 [Colobus angolensis palliatus]XP_011795136.1 PREDICTED: fibroblast growth factor 1 isoform X3 [Colobus angolensis palliatus]XP_011795137.1 PREDICTED: fibroblast growth factor 1 isoform X3 [Colobus angolensis palliatus]